MNLSKLVYVEKYGREWQRNWEADHDTIEFIEKELEINLMLYLSPPLK